MLDCRRTCKVRAPEIDRTLACTGLGGNTECVMHLYCVLRPWGACESVSTRVGWASREHGVLILGPHLRPLAGGGQGVPGSMQDGCTGVVVQVVRQQPTGPAPTVGDT